jgi:hypothetical protein
LSSLIFNYVDKKISLTFLLLQSIILLIIFLLLIFVFLNMQKITKFDIIFISYAMLTHSVMHNLVIISI